MSRYMGAEVHGQIPPYIPKTKSGRPPYKRNKYAKLRQSEQENTSGQRRVRREEAKRG